MQAGHTYACRRMLPCRQSTTAASEVDSASGILRLFPFQFEVVFLVLSDIHPLKPFRVCIYKDIEWDIAPPVLF